MNPISVLLVDDNPTFLRIAISCEKWCSKRHTFDTLENLQTPSKRNGSTNEASTCPEQNQRDRRYRNGNEHLIELRQLEKTYESAAGAFTALTGADLQANVFAKVELLEPAGLSLLIKEVCMAQAAEWITSGIRCRSG